MDNYDIFLEKAKKAEESADKMIYVLYPLLKDIHLLKKGLEEIGNCMLNVVACFLAYENEKSGLELMRSGEGNWHLFKRNAEKLGLHDKNLEIMEYIMDLAKKHKESAFEFVREDKIFITSNGFKTDSFDKELLKNYLSICKSLVISLENYFSYRKTGFVKP